MARRHGGRLGLSNGRPGHRGGGQPSPPGKPVVVASGLSPSGPIHLGNLREVMTPHFVADEMRRRGVECVHILSWDDYDRFRRVPAGIDPSWSRHIGKPLTSVPAPEGSRYPNWAEHFKAPMIDAAGRLGIEFLGISQTERYTVGRVHRPGADGHARTGEDRCDPGPPPHQTQTGERSRGASEWPVRGRSDARPGPRRRDRAPPPRTMAERVGSTFRTGPTAPCARAMPRRSSATTTTPRRLPMSASAGTARQWSCRRTIGASWYGRSIGPCAGPTKA